MLMNTEATMNFIAVDIGASRMRVALYPDLGLDEVQLKVIPTRGEGSILERLVGLIASVWPEGREVNAIGLAVAGLVDPASGMIRHVVNIANWDGLPIGELLSARFQVPVRIGNDANLAALGEYHYGAGRGHDNLLYLTISTGIGAGVIINGRLLTGERGLAGEIGHITVEPNGPLCSCGQRGHLEAICSGPAIVRFVLEGIQTGRDSLLTGAEPGLDASRVAEAARQGDDLCVEAFREAGNVLGRTLADLLHVFDPGAIILGGGVVQAGNMLLEPLERSLHANVLSEAYLNGLLVTTAQLGDSSGLVGALALARS